MQKNPHVEISKLAFKNIIEMVKFAFQKVKSVTYERSKLISRAQQSGETLDAFHAALTAQAARSELGTLGGQLVRDFFISRKKNASLQDILTVETLSPEVIKRAILFEYSNQTNSELQKTNSLITPSSSPLNNTAQNKHITEKPQKVAARSPKASAPGWKLRRTVAKKTKKANRCTHKEKSDRQK